MFKSKKGARFPSKIFIASKKSLLNVRGFERSHERRVYKMVPLGLQCMPMHADATTSFVVVIAMMITLIFVYGLSR